MTCIKGSDESHFNVSVGSDGQCHKTQLLKRKESRSGIEPRSFRLPAYRLTARPNQLSPPRCSTRQLSCTASASLVQLIHHKAGNGSRGTLAYTYTSLQTQARTFLRIASITDQSSYSFLRVKKNPRGLFNRRARACACMCECVRVCAYVSAFRKPDKLGSTDAITETE